MTRRGDIVRIVRPNTYNLIVGNEYMVCSGADIEGTICVWVNDSKKAVLLSKEYRTVSTS